MNTTILNAIKQRLSLRIPLQEALDITATIADHVPLNKSKYLSPLSLINEIENETLDSALRRFKRNCAKAGIQQEIRKREHYEKPSVKRKKKSEAARKRKFK